MINMISRGVVATYAGPGDGWLVYSPDLVWFRDDLDRITAAMLSSDQIRVRIAMDLQVAELVAREVGGQIIRDADLEAYLAAVGEAQAASDPEIRY